MIEVLSWAAITVIPALLGVNVFFIKRFIERLDRTHDGVLVLREQFGGVVARQGACEKRMSDNEEEFQAFREKSMSGLGHALGEIKTLRVLVNSRR